MPKVTLEDFENFARPRLAEGIRNSALFTARITEVFNYAFDDKNELDDQAKARVDELMKGFAEIMGEGVAKLPDSPDKRSMQRKIAAVKGKHFSVTGMARGLASEPPDLPVARAAKPIFQRILQSVLDVLFDATRGKQKGVGQLGTLSMFYWAVDELNVAFHLAERKYATQAYGHLRTVYDLLEKIELFHKQPQWAEVWAGSDTQKILRELSPGGVRKKLGRPKFDFVYSFLSELGSHGTFEAVRRRVVKRKQENRDPHIAIWVAGVAIALRVQT